jgi:hypothetical protein
VLGASEGLHKRDSNEGSAYLEYEVMARLSNSRHRSRLEYLDPEAVELADRLRRAFPDP